jgi:hypothetical protein
MFVSGLRSQARLTVAACSCEEHSIKRNAIAAENHILCAMGARARASQYIQPVSQAVTHTTIRRDAVI